MIEVRKLNNNTTKEVQSLSNQWIIQSQHIGKRKFEEAKNQWIGAVIFIRFTKLLKRFWIIN